ncbi:MAG: hypothetical protein JNL38_12660 [Myxococcales bacterium]|nr:hypothetical protein [Myxococcales bacterium]
MKTTTSLFLAAIVGLAAACGGGVAVDPIGKPEPGPTPTPTASGTTPNPGPTATPYPTAPYVGAVATTDVSILYPLPGPGASRAFVRPSDAGAHGVLLPKATFDAVLPGGRLDRVRSVASGYGDVAVLGVRLDPCSMRNGACTPEVRLVMQQIYEKTAPEPDGDPETGAAADDGALHVIYDVPDPELVTMMKQILTLKAAQGGASSTTLGVHPILAVQGLGGAFARDLKRILLEHVGASRLARVTVFDHNFDPDEDGWSFRTFDVVGGGPVAKNVPGTSLPSLTLAGSPAFGSGAAFFADSRVAAQADMPGVRVDRLLEHSRPAKGDPAALSLGPAFARAVDVQKPGAIHAENTDCGTCHMAEAARQIGESVYGLKPTAPFTHARDIGYASSRYSVSNLHAFGYLHRKIAIMQRTANESVLVAEAMEQKVK